MKHLTDYISEAAVEQKINEAESVTISFDFKDLENGEETLKSLEGKEGCTIEDDKLTLTVDANNVDKLGAVQDILQQFSETIRKSTKSTNDESYAQKTASFEKKVGELNDAIDKIKNPEEE